MIENAKLFDRLVADGLLKPIDVDDPVPLYLVKDIQEAFLAYTASKLRK